jgi:RHS repeat-associated protein
LPPVWGGGDPFGETLNQLKDAPIPEVSFYIQDHLGNTRIMYHTTFTDCNQAAVLYHLEHVADYYPFGKILREYVAQGLPEKFLTTQHERDVETGLDYRGARFYDSEVGRFLGVDPLASERSWVSPYNYVQNNPILRVDPTGALDGEYEITHDSDGNEIKTKVSTLGDDVGIDFNHHLDGEFAGQTEIVNSKNGFSNWISDSRYIRGYAHRDGNTSWNTIFQEWRKGTGPENSLVFGRDHPMIKDIRTSSLYHRARNEYLTDKAWDFDCKISKKYIPVDFGLKGLLLSGTNMTMQMIGASGVSFYDIGDNQRLVVMTDSKNKTSFYYHLPIENTKRNTVMRETFYGSNDWYYDNRQTTTNQTYIWIDNNIEEE